MIEIKQVKTENQELYGFVEELMHTAFPAQERRDTPQQREYSDSNPLFCNNVIVEDGKPVGMISYWDMGDFYYIEHFAIDPSLRNGGYGKRVLESIQTKLQAHIRVVKVCRRVWQLKRGRSTVPFGFFASTSSLQSRMMRRMALFSVP